MDQFDRRTFSQNQRFYFALAVGLVASVIIGIASGWLRAQFDIVIILWGACLAIAYVIQKTGRGVQTRFSILAGVLAIACMLISDVVMESGVASLLDLQAYGLILTNLFRENMQSLLWIVYRGAGIYIAFNYSRII